MTYRSHRGAGPSAGPRRAGAGFAAVLLGLMASACAQLPWSEAGPAQESAGEDAVPPPVERSDGLAYETSLEGVEKEGLRTLLQETSQLRSLQERAPATLTALRRRAERDVERLQAALRSEGYYAGSVRYELDPAAEPVAVRLLVEPGPRYRLAAYDVSYEQSPVPPASVRPRTDELGLERGKRARAPEIVGAQRRLLDHLAGRGYPLATVIERKTFVNHETREMTVELRVDAGPFTRFGPLTVTGLERVKEDHVRDLVLWREGEAYNNAEVEAGRAALLATGLFEAVRMEPADEPGPDGTLPVTVKLSEAKRRSIGFGLGYSTSEGFTSEAFWEHRNLFGRNEQLRLSLTAGEIEQSVKADFRKPNFIYPELALLASTAVANRNTEAFDEQSVSAFVGLERPWAENWLLTGGVSGEYNVVTDDAGERTFQLVGLPLTAARDVTDNPLNPTGGTKLSLGVTPYYGTGDENLAFVTATSTGSAYYAIDEEERYILAGRARLGVLAGADTATVPASKRFYSGGGGSIRGYEFQSVGPLDADDDPLGGSSVIEVGGELRVRLSETIGVVPFIDGGTVYDSSYPSFDETFRWAAGLGFRYFTAIGPVRLDIAVPLNKRDRDDSFQVYISLGQAF